MISSNQSLMFKKIKWRTEQIIMNVVFHVKPFWVTIRNYISIVAKIPMRIDIDIMNINQHDQ